MNNAQNDGAGGNASRFQFRCCKNKIERST